MQQKELLNKNLPETWKLALSKSIENKLFSKVMQQQTSDPDRSFV
jgi:hypothetical protein